MSETIVRVLRIYQGSDGAATTALYAELEQLGPVGVIAVNLFRASKTSGRAKVYRGSGYRGAAYDRKNWSIGNLCDALSREAESAGLVWGWGEDEKQPFHKFVVYVDLPTGQVSFHSAERLGGPDYPGKWDGMPGQSGDRICRWCARLLAARVPA